MTLLLPDPPAVRPTHAARLDVDLAAVALNTATLARAARGAALMAVVKADGFGLGAADVARTALAHGATWLGVTSLREALDLRGAGIDAPVLSWLNPADPDLATAAATAGVDLAVPSLEHLAAVVAHGGPCPVRVHLHLDTGLARDGAAPQTWLALCGAARRAERAGRLRVVGVMGHLACADEPGHPANARGRAAFAHGVVVARAAGLRPQVHHLAATSATLTDADSHHDLVRVGAGLVGIDPTGTHRLAGALTLTAPVVGLRRVPAGTPVGYGHSWVAPEATTLALLPVGYADGLPRLASGRAAVLLGGRRCAVVGRISMDQAVVAAPASTRLGDVATVLGPGHAGEPTVHDWAAWSGTLPHEVLTGLGARPRVTR